MGRPKSADPSASRTFAIRRSVEAKMDALDLRNRSAWLNRVIEEECQRIAGTREINAHGDLAQARLNALKAEEEEATSDALNALPDLRIIEQALRRVARHNRSAEKPLKQLESNLFKAYTALVGDDDGCF